MGVLLLILTRLVYIECMLQVIKIGGSVITDKSDTSPKVNYDRLRDLLLEVQEYIDNSDDSVILIHGAGAYGHGTAGKYKLQYGATTEEKVHAAEMCQQQVSELHNIFIQTAAVVGLPVDSVPTHTVLMHDKGTVTVFDTSPVMCALDRGSIPVLYGDVVPDDTWTYSICSGDTIAAQLAVTAQAERLIFASDIDGVCTANPHTDSTATLIREVSITDIMNGNIQGVSTAHTTDVTGGLLGKLNSFAHIMKTSKLQEVVLCNGTKKDRLGSTLRGELTECTKVTRPRTTQG